MHRGPLASSTQQQSRLPHELLSSMSQRWGCPPVPGAHVSDSPLQEFLAGEGVWVPGGVSCSRTRLQGCSARPA